MSPLVFPTFVFHIEFMPKTTHRWPILTRLNPRNPWFSYHVGMSCRVALFKRPPIGGQSFQIEPTEPMVSTPCGHVVSCCSFQKTTHRWPILTRLNPRNPWFP